MTSKIILKLRKLKYMSLAEILRRAMHLFPLAHTPKASAVLRQSEADSPAQPARDRGPCQCCRRAAAMVRFPELTPTKGSTWGRGRAAATHGAQMHACTAPTAKVAHVWACASTKQSPGAGAPPWAAVDAHGCQTSPTNVRTRKIAGCKRVLS
jgi:hypothetical protein